MKIEELTAYWDIVETGKPHLVGEGMNMTHTFLKHDKDVKAPLAFHKRLTQPKSEVKVYKLFTDSRETLFGGDNIGDVFYIRYTNGVGTRRIQASVIDKSKKHNLYNNTNKVYATHKDKDEVRVERVG